MAETAGSGDGPTIASVPDDLRGVARLHEAYGRIRRELARVIVGQEEVIDLLLIALFARGHVILEGVPGLAKTLMISSLARCLGLRFHRIQFMPDLMPADITGTEVIQEDRRTGQRSVRFLPGPIFANVILADEINRTPPKTQAALLEAMQELTVTVGGVRHPIEPPFFVLATQNPIEQEGTYPLPEAQQDRFMFKVFVNYPSYEEEFEIADRTPGGPDHNPARSGGSGDPLIRRLVTFGAGPRAVQFLLLGGKARAVMQGRCCVSIEDIRALAHAVLRHRIIVNYAAEAEDYNADRIIDHLLEVHPARPLDGAAHAAVQQVFGS
jgi:MoxR-like ATPase